MEKFGHLFEFLATINVANIVTFQFGKSLLDLFGKRLINEKTANDQILKKWEGVHAYLNDRHQKTDKVLQDEILTFLGDSLQIKDEIKRAGEGINEAMNHKFNSYTFNNLSLFGGLYSILILISNGFEFDLTNQNENLFFFILNVLMLLVVLWIFFKKPTNLPGLFSIRLHKIILAIPIAILLALTFSFILIFMFGIKLFPEMMFFSQLLSIMIAGIHFIAFTIRAAFFKTAKYAGENNSVNLKLGDLNKRVTEKIQSMDKLKVALKTRVFYKCGEIVDTIGYYQCMSHIDHVINFKEGEYFTECDICRSNTSWKHKTE